MTHHLKALTIAAALTFIGPGLIVLALTLIIAPLKGPTA